MVGHEPNMEDITRKRSQAVDSTNNVVDCLLHNIDTGPKDDRSHTARVSDSNALDVSTHYKEQAVDPGLR